jgi:capsular exopolysaccharide synthesis family protein
MDLWQHFRAIWRYKVRVLLASIVVAAAVYVLSGTRAEVYDSSATLSVFSGRAAAGEPVTADQLTLLVGTYSELAKTRTSLEQAIEVSDLAISVDTADARVSVEAAGDTGFFDVRAVGPTPESAALLADAMATVLRASVAERQEAALEDSLAPLRVQIADLEQQLASLDEASASRPALEARYGALVQALADQELRPRDRLELVADARESTTPIAPTPLRDGVLALVVALIVNGELAVAWSRFGGRFSRKDLDEEVATMTGQPVLARVPAREGPAQVEAFRILRTNLSFTGMTEGLRSLAIVGSEPGSGKSFTSLRLAEAVVAGGVKVVLVDADLRRPTLHRKLGIDVERGLSDVQAHESFANYVVPVRGVENLWLLPAGSVPDDPSATMQARLQRILRDISWAELLIFDTPASLLFADASSIAAACDATLVVVDAKSNRGALRRTMRDLEQVNANVLGIVANRVDLNTRSSYYDRYRREQAGDDAG